MTCAAVNHHFKTRVSLSDSAFIVFIISWVFGLWKKEAMILLLLFSIAYGERNFRKRAFHKQLLREENKIVKTSLKTTISVRKLFGHFNGKIWYFNPRHSYVFICMLMHASHASVLICVTIFAISVLRSL